MEARWLPWSMKVVLPFWPIVAWPPTTVPPVGLVLGDNCAAAGVASTTTKAARSAVACSRAVRLQRRINAMRIVAGGWRLGLRAISLSISKIRPGLCTGPAGAVGPRPPLLRGADEARGIP